MPRKSQIPSNDVWAAARTNLEAGFEPTARAAEANRYTPLWSDSWAFAINWMAPLGYQDKTGFYFGSPDPENAADDPDLGRN